MIATPLRRAKALGIVSVKPAELSRVYPTIPAFLGTVTETSDSPPVSPNKTSLELLDDPDILLPNPDRQEVLETRNLRQSYSSNDCFDTASDTRQKHCTNTTSSKMLFDSKHRPEIIIVPHTNLHQFCRVHFSSSSCYATIG